MRLDDRVGRGANNGVRTRSHHAPVHRLATARRWRFLVAGVAPASLLVGAALMVLGTALSVSAPARQGVGLDLPLQAAAQDGVGAGAARAAGAAPSRGLLDAPIAPPARADPSPPIAPTLDSGDAIVPPSRDDRAPTHQPDPREGVPPLRATRGEDADPEPAAAPLGLDGSNEEQAPDGEPELERDPDAEPGGQLEPAGEPAAEVEPESVGELEPEAEPEPVGELEPEAEPEPSSGSAPASEQTREPTPEPEPDDERSSFVALPTRVEIPRLGVRSDLLDLHLDAQGRLEVPQDPALAGWWTGGPRPGQAGPAVIVGHVDSAVGPAVFHGLPRLEPGDEIVVHRADDTRARFAVQGVERWPKDGFPTQAVYRNAEGAELRLITCGGRFDRQALRYLDNVIVFAREVTDDR